MTPFAFAARHAMNWNDCRRKFGEAELWLLCRRRWYVLSSVPHLRRN